jgi:GNAT superfamily N-acetyltransferase
MLRSGDMLGALPGRSAKRGGVTSGYRAPAKLTDVCYLQDLFTAETARGRGIGRRLIYAVYEAASAAGSSRVYWQTNMSNEPGRALYDQVAEHRGFIVYTHEF